MKLNILKPFITGVFFTSCMVNAANASVIIEATNATVSTPSSYAPIDTINQSGLVTNYVSGVDNFDTYMSSNPLHNDSWGDEWYSIYGVSSTSITFDLGGIYTLDAIALWNQDYYTSNVFGEFFSSLDGINFSSLAPSIDVSQDHNNYNPYAARTFEFADFNAMYIRLDMTQCSGYCSIGEIAFSSVDVPEPSTLAVFALGVIGLATRRFKKQS